MKAVNHSQITDVVLIMGVLGYVLQWITIITIVTNEISQAKKVNSIVM